MLTTLAVGNYRSLRDLRVPLQALNVVTGANGTGKSSLYRALRLLAETAQGTVTASLAQEGGLTSTLWAGPEVITDAMRAGEQPVQGTRRTKPVALRLGFASDDFGYAIELGLPMLDDRTMFVVDPEIKRECIWAGPILRPAALLIDRKGPLVRSRGARGGWTELARNLERFDSMLTQLADPERAPEILTLRDRIRSWRFYDHFRSDADAPARQPHVGTRTPVLSHDGHDLASALQTIHEIGDAAGLEAAVRDAFPGGLLSITSNQGRFDLEMWQEGLLRPLGVRELSDGTLRYLLWIAALLTPRPPALMVLNEPETSLHPDLLPALARLIVRAAERTQLWVVSHARALTEALETAPGCASLVLSKDTGETQLAGQSLLDGPAWSWPAR